MVIQLLYSNIRALDFFSLEKLLETTKQFEKCACTQSRKLYLNMKVTTVI